MTYCTEYLHLPAGALVNNLVPTASIGFLVIVHVMLRVRDDALGLDATDDWLHQFVAKVWIFSREISAHGDTV